MAVAPDGTTTVVWLDRNGGDPIVQSVTRPPGGSFGPVTTLSTAGSLPDIPHIAVAPDGTMTVVWVKLSAPPVIQATTRPPGGSFGTPVNLSGPDEGPYDPRIVAGPDGSLTVVWESDDDTDMRLRAAWTEPGPVTLTTARTGTGSGTVTSIPAGIDCGSTCQASFTYGSTVTLSASADSGSTFTGWSGACSGIDLTCTVTMDQARQVTATFTKDEIPGPKVPANPPNNNVAIYNPANGKLKIRLKCGPQYRPKCLRMVARVVAGKGKRARVWSNQIRVRNRRAGRWGFATLRVKPKFRQRVRNLGNRQAKTLWVRIGVTWKKKGKKRSRTIHHRYRVMVRE